MCIRDSLSILSLTRIVVLLRYFGTLILCKFKVELQTFALKLRHSRNSSKEHRRQLGHRLAPEKFLHGKASDGHHRRAAVLQLRDLQLLHVADPAISRGHLRDRVDDLNRKIRCSKIRYF